MKKIIALILACLMLTMSFVACTDNGDGETTTDTPAGSDTTTAPEADQTTEEVTEEVVELPYNSAEELLNIIYEGYNAAQASDDTKLWVGGGNIYNFDTVNPEAPAKFVALADTDYEENLGYPAADASKLDDAASMFNLMNTNNFNCYTLHFTNSADVDAMTTSIKDNILARQWICGAPEKLVIVKIPGDYLLVVWGAVNYGGIVDPFVASIPTLVEGATVVVEHTFAQ